MLAVLFWVVSGGFFVLQISSSAPVFKQILLVFYGLCLAIFCAIAGGLGFLLWPLVCIAAIFSCLFAVSECKQSNAASYRQWFELQGFIGLLLSVNFFSISQNSELILITVAALVALAGFLRVKNNIKQSLYTSSKQISAEALPTVSLAIPARNEGKTLTETLRSVAGLDYPKLEVLVLDDCSHDKTPEIIRAYANDGIRFIEGQLPDEDWLGRNYALEQLRIAANGELFVYMDVNVHVSEQSILKLVDFMQSTKADVVSVHPASRTTWKLGSIFASLRSFWKLLLFKTPIHGQFMAIRSSAMQDIGGFESFKDSYYFEVKLLKSITNTRTIVDGASLGISVYYDVAAHTRKNLRDLFPFFDKNMFAASFFATMVAVCFVWPCYFLLFESNILALVPLVMWWFTHYQIARIELGVFSGLTASLFLPLKVFGELVLLVVSAVLYSLRRVFWKERNICLPLYDIADHLPKF